MQIRPVAFLASSVALVAAAATCVTCGPGTLARAYDAYEPKAAALLDPEMRLRAKIVGQFNRLLSDPDADLAAFESLLTREAVPFYGDFARGVAALPVGDP